MTFSFPVQSKALSSYEGVVHGFFGRAHQAQDIERAWELPLVSATQIHSAHVVVIEKAGQEGMRCDGLVTKKRGIVLGVRTADCVPLLLATPSCVAALHAGWRGFFAGIIEEGVRVMKKQGADMTQCRAVLGPSIMQDSYEVGAEFKEYLRQKSYEPSLFLKKSVRAGRFLFDLRKAVQESVQRCGIMHVDMIDINNHAYPHDFFSHRRTQGEGSQLSVIGMR